MKDCLEDNREQPGFSAECKEEFEAMMEARAADFRLDSTLREVRCARQPPLTWTRDRAICGLHAPAGAGRQALALHHAAPAALASYMQATDTAFRLSRG